MRIRPSSVRAHAHAVNRLTHVEHVASSFSHRPTLASLTSGIWRCTTPARSFAATAPPPSLPARPVRAKPQRATRGSTKAPAFSAQDEYVVESSGMAALDDADAESWIDDMDEVTSGGMGESSSARTPSAMHTGSSARAVRGPSLYETKAVASLDGITIVNDLAASRRVIDMLRTGEIRTRYHACDTEVMDIDVKNQSVHESSRAAWQRRIALVCQQLMGGCAGLAVCVMCLVRSPVGHGRVTCFSIYVGPDVDFGTGARLWVDVLDGEAGLLELWRAYFEDAGIKKVWHNYSFDRHILFNHGIHVKGFGGDTMHMARLWDAARMSYSLESLSLDLLKQRKRPMKELFCMPKLKKDGTEGKAQELPPVDKIQRDAFFRDHWIYYSVYDTQSTWELRNVLATRLSELAWTTGQSMLTFYDQYWRPFGELLVDLEETGFYVRAKDYLPTLEVQAEVDKAAAVEQFRQWASQQSPDAKYMNISSSVQKQHFFFGKKGDVRMFDTENTDGFIEEGKKVAKKKKQFALVGLGMKVEGKTAKNTPAVSLAVLKKLCGQVSGDKPKYGSAYAYFGGGESGKAACEAIHALCKVSAVTIMLNTFIKPLQDNIDAHSRIHCSLNLNTETGRLSSRRPNLQNQPALEKDIYKIRDAFAAKEGCSLIVADYGQLELRLLAHMARCTSMIEAFKLGGDFHSRTAMGMYPHVAEAVKKGEVLLEWDERQGEAPAPLLKDKFGAERRKAKTLNFSIAYGKTAKGLSLDWNVSVEEAAATVARWYSDRPEVKAWQEQTIATAHETGCTRTLMGRYRPLPGINSPNMYLRGHSERAAINTPVQGGAADVVMKAMLELHAHEGLRKLGWKMILQVHDEIICEGPTEHVDEAMSIVRHCMEHPFMNPLLIDLVVDANADTTWYKAK